MCIFFRLLLNITETPSGFISSDELCNKLHHLQNNGKNSLNVVVVGKIIKKLFTSANVTLKRSKTSGKHVRVYTGLSWKISTDTAIQWNQLPDLIPRTSCCLQVAPDVFSFGIPDKLICNGNIIVKQVTLTKDTLTWKLKIRGKYIDLDKHGIDKHFQLTSESIDNILMVIDKLQLCIGSGCTDNEFLNNGVSFLQEWISVEGDENSSRLRVRSVQCSQILGWYTTGFSETCRKCQIACCKYRAKRQKQEQSNCVLDANVLSINDINKYGDSDSGVLAASPSTDSDHIDLSEEDNADLMSVMEKVLPNATEEMKVLLKAQHDALSAKTKQSHRWDKQVIRVCLTMWVRSPKAYEDLKESNMLILPSGRQLRRYKNCVPQNPGICDDILEWMLHTANDNKIPDHGRAGGIHHDETKLQEDLVLCMSGGKPTLVGWVEGSEEATNLRIVRAGKVQQTLASEVIQFSFLGYTGFRFPICHFPTKGIKASELYIIIWEAVAKLADWGFQVDYIMQDGGEENRQFIKFHFPEDPLACSYTSLNLTDQSRKMFHIQDFSHNMKKIRNSIIHSGDIKGQHTRKLSHNGKVIVWQQWINAVQWDRMVNSRCIHHKVTDTHLYPNGSEKMRNQLAEDMLDTNMLHLMQCYQASLGDNENAAHLSGAVELLQQTSKLISVFRDQRPITQMDDERLLHLEEIKNWFQSWRDSVNNNSEVAPADKSKMLPTRQCMEDILCMLVTFPKVCELHLKEYPKGYIIPSRFNNDIAENLFCQVRGLHNGNTTHPNYASYKSTMNSVMLGQSAISIGRKSNAGLQAANPFNFYTHRKCKEESKRKDKRL